DLELRGVHAHNLNHLDLDLPLGRWITLTGPSGSGKTTLAFDVLHRASQRRYLGALSAKALQTLGKLGSGREGALRNLPVSLATGVGALTPSARSTVGTLTGIASLLRLLFARSGHHPSERALSRSQFSFNHDRGACPSCRGLGVEDQVHPDLLVADPTKTLRVGALKPTLPNGYTVYSQVTLEVMDTICHAHGFDVDTPWQDLTPAQRDVIFYGTTALTVPFGKHGLESRMSWVGITARPREEGHYLGLIPVIEQTLKRDRNPNILRYVRTIPCTDCHGTRLGPVGRETRVGGVTLPELLARPMSQLGAALDALPPSAVRTALSPTLHRRLHRMEQLSLGHLSLDRASTTLSGGEGQRIRLAAQVAGGLGGLLVVLDEPTLGLHPSAQPGMAAVLEELRSAGNTLLVVDHDPAMVQRADHWLALGPGAGVNGGRVVHHGPMPPAALVHHLPPQAPPPPSPGAITLRGAALHTLDGVDITVALSAFTVVSGPSGAGKSSLVFGTLLPALQGKLGGPFTALSGVPDGLTVRWVNAEPIGRTPRSTPATYTGLFDQVRKRFAATAEAKAAALGASRFSYNAKGGRCPTCGGLGVVRVGMHLLRDVERTCLTCGGSRYAAEVMAIRLRGKTIAEVLGQTVDEAVTFFASDPPILAICQALAQLGLGYLPLGQPSNTLSRGEAQRVKLASILGAPAAGPSLVLLDEPDRGLHPDDVLRLLRCLRSLVDRRHTVLAISHHPMVWHAAHHRFALRDGRQVEPAPVPSLPERPAAREPATVGPIVLTGVRTHNLAGIDVRIAHGRITAVTGVSGSGKSSLVFDTLAAVAWSRYAESLPFEVRRHLRQQPAPELDDATGLTPVIALRQGQGRPGPRATVGTLSRIDRDLRLLWSRLARVDGAPTALTASHFSANHALGACPACGGAGVLQRCDPARLITHPERALAAGAMDGSKPGAFFGEPDGQYLATLRVAARAAGLDVSGPVAEVSPAARRLALEGAGEAVFDVTWDYSRGKRSGTHTFRGPWVGLCALVETEAKIRAKRKNAAEWSAPLAPVPCPGCDGERLIPAARRALVSGLRLPEVRAQPLSAVHETLREMAVDHADTAVIDAVRPGLLRRIATLVDLGLGHLSSARSAASLSRGELQRLRLAGVLVSDLGQVTLVLDEPGAGLDPDGLALLVDRLRAFCTAGNTVVLVSHRSALVAGADDVLTLGPGAGADGGRLVPTPPAVTETPRVALGEHGWLQIRGADAHTLRSFDLDLPDRGLVAITGPSGSGKSTLLFDVLGASATSGRASGCAALSGLDRFTEHHLSAQSTVRTPLTTLGLSPAVKALFHSVGSGLPRNAFSFHSASGRCPACKGLGHKRVAMDFMADLCLDCPACNGTRFAPAVLAVRWQGLTVAELLAMPVGELVSTLPAGPLVQACRALIEVGLAHIRLGRPGHVLSHGEHQRVLLAAALAKPGVGRSLFLFDEPGSGLHPEDLERLVGVLYRLVERGSCVVLTTHRRRLIEAAQWRVALGPGGGPDGGALVHSGVAD
ncbi:MAG: excinuclease ABC subunit A, partial [Myxococcota bacterium]